MPLTSPSLRRCSDEAEVEEVALVELSRPKQWPTLSRRQMQAEGFPVYGANGLIGFSDKYTHEKPTIIIGCRGSCGSLHITEARSYVTGNAMALDNLDTDRVDQNYVFYFLRKRGFDDVISGSSQPQITGKGLSRVRIPVPPLVEQRHIAAILDKAEGMQRKRQEAVTAAGEFLQSAFQEAFGNKSFPREGEYYRSVGDLLNDGQILAIQDGNHGEIHPKSRDFSDKGIPFVTANMLSTGKLVTDGANHLGHEWINRLRIGFSKPGDVLLTHKGSIGFSTIVGDDNPNLILSPQVTYYRLNLDHVLPEYLQAYFCSSYFQNMLQRFSKQSTRDYIGITRQKNLKVSIPPLAHSQRILRGVQRIRAGKHRLQHSI